MKLGTLKNDFVGTSPDRDGAGPDIACLRSLQTRIPDQPNDILAAPSGLGFAAPDIAGLIGAPQDLGDSKSRIAKSAQLPKDQPHKSFHDHLHDQKHAPTNTDLAQDEQELASDGDPEPSDQLTTHESNTLQEPRVPETSTDVGFAQSDAPRPTSAPEGQDVTLFTTDTAVSDDQDGQTVMTANEDTEAAENGTVAQASGSQRGVQSALSIFEMQAAIANRSAKTAGANLPTSPIPVQVEQTSVGPQQPMLGAKSDPASAPALSVDRIPDNTILKDAALAANTIQTGPDGTKTLGATLAVNSAPPVDTGKSPAIPGDRASMTRPEAQIATGQGAKIAPTVSGPDNSGGEASLGAAAARILTSDQIEQSSRIAAGKNGFDGADNSQTMELHATGLTKPKQSSPPFNPNAGSMDSPETSDIAKGTGVSRSRDGASELTPDRMQTASQHPQSATAPVTGVNVTDQPIQASAATATETGVDLFGDLAALDSRGAELDILKPGSQQQTAFSASHQPTAQLRASPAQATAHLGQMIIQGNETLSEITMDPEELGKVRFQIVQAEAGLTISITAERPETLDMMRRHIEQLQQDLSQNGFTDVSFSFSQNEKGDQGQDGSDDTGGSAQSQDSSPTHIAETDPVQISPITLSPSDGIDIRL